MTKPIVNVNVGGPTKPSCTYKTKVLKGNLPFVSQISDDDTKYVIKFDFDLGGGSVTIPTGCLLEFDGGSLSNGTVVGQETILIYHQAFADILHDVTTEGTFVWDKITTDDESIIENDGVLQVNTNGILAKHIKAGEVTGAKLNADVVDDSTLEIAGNKIKAKAGGIQGQHLNANVADNSSLVLSGNALGVKAGGIQGSMLNSNVVDDEDVHLTADNKIQLKDKAYAPAAFSGLGRKYLRKNIVSNKNVLTQDMMSEANTIYVIQYDYDLNGATVTVPAGCTLEFGGGSIKNGVLIGNYKNSVLDVTNFGLVGDAETDNSAAFVNMLNGITTTSNCAHYVLYFPKGDYLFRSNNIFGSFSSTSVLGMTVKGDSRTLTSLVLDTSDGQEKWFYTNSSNGKLQSLEFEDITLMTTDPIYGNGLKLTSTGHEKRPKFINCGLFLGTVLQCEGTANADLSIIDNCTICALKVLVLDNYQSVTHRITNCNIVFVYNVVYSTKGGCVYIENCNIENYNWWRRQGYNQSVSVYKTIYNDDEAEPTHPIIYSVGGTTAGNSSININNSRFEIHNTGSFVYAGNKCNVSFCGCECGTYSSSRYASHIADKAVVKFVDDVFGSAITFSIKNVKFAVNDAGPMLFIDRCSLNKHGDDDIVALLDNNDTAISVNFGTVIFCSVKVSNCYNNTTGEDGNNYRIQDFDITGKSRGVFHSGINRKCVYPDAVSQSAYGTSAQGTLICKLPKYNTFVGFDLYLNGNNSTTEYYYVVGVGFDESETVIYKTDYFKLNNPSTFHFDCFCPYKYKAIYLKRKAIGSSGQQASSSMVVYYV